MNVLILSAHARQTPAAKMLISESIEIDSLFLGSPSYTFLACLFFFSVMSYNSPGWNPIEIFNNRGLFQILHHLVKIQRLPLSNFAYFSCASNSFCVTAMRRKNCYFHSFLSIAISLNTSSQLIIWLRFFPLRVGMEFAVELVEMELWDYQALPGRQDPW